MPRRARTRTDNREARERLTAANRRVLAFNVALVACAVLAYTRGVAGEPTLDAPFHLPGWGLALGFAAAEIFVIHLQFRREAHSISLNEIPIVLGLFFADPAAMVAAHVVGSAVVLYAYRRQPPLKLAFNLSHFAVESTLAVIVFRAVSDSGGGSMGPRMWLAALLATLTVDILAALAVTAVISIHEGHLQPQQLPRVATVGAITAVVNTTLALIAVTSLWGDGRVAWLLAAAGGALLLAYRAYASLTDRHSSLALLYEFSRAVGRSQKAEEVVEEVLAKARELLRAEVAEITLLPIADGDDAHRVTLGRDTAVVIEFRSSLELDATVARVLDQGQPVVIPRTTRDPLLRAHLTAHGFRDAITAPLRGDDGVIGTIAVADRLGDVSTFDAEDARLFETIANHASVALQNGRLIDRLRHDALHDSLTGLPNRTMFQEKLRDTLGRVPGSQRPGAVMLMDLDRFKDVNDSLGHHIGDVLLQEVSNRLRDTLDPSITIARLGGDEFALLLHDAADEEEAVEQAKRVQRELERPFEHEELSLEVGATIGMALYPAHGLDASTLLKRADVAMYSAKGTAARLEVYSPETDQHSPRRLALVGELRAAIENGGLDVHYMPKADLRTGDIVGAEALVRWSHPTDGFIPPDEFVALAEHTGLIGPLTTMVLNHALGQCVSWQAFRPGVGVAVNLSTRSLLDHALPDEVDEALRAAGLAPGLLTLEITESSIMTDPRRARAVLDRLREMGVRISVDDFGTGYSSLSYLTRLPVDEVKVDKSFVLGLTTNPDNAAIVRSIVDLGRNLGLAVVAEGIEDEGVWRRLRTLECRLGQGYYLSRALPSADFTAWLRERPTATTRLRLVAGLH